MSSKIATRHSFDSPTGSFFRSVYAPCCTCTKIGLSCPQEKMMTSGDLASSLGYRSFVTSDRSRAGVGRPMGNLNRWIVFLPAEETYRREFLRCRFPKRGNNSCSVISLRSPRVGVDSTVRLQHTKTGRYKQLYLFQVRGTSPALV